MIPLISLIQEKITKWLLPLIFFNFKTNLLFFILLNYLLLLYIFWQILSLLKVIIYHNLLLLLLNSLLIIFIMYSINFDCAFFYLNQLRRYLKQQKQLSKSLVNFLEDRGGRSSRFCETLLSSDSSIVISWRLKVSDNSWLWCLDPFNLTGKNDISSGSLSSDL